MFVTKDPKRIQVDSKSSDQPTQMCTCKLVGNGVSRLRCHAPYSTDMKIDESQNSEFTFACIQIILKFTRNITRTITSQNHSEIILFL